MRLIRLALQNFRQHADTQLEFRPGLTGIIGPNGAGKTTILEAIAWVIYGTPAIRGTRDSIRFNRALGRVTEKVELEFELCGERYRVWRGPRDAELYRADGEDPVARGLSEVTRQLGRRLGMSYQEFFNTYFTGQKQLQFLGAMGPTERARFLSQVLGYERLRAAQTLVRDERKVLKGKADELRQSLGDVEELQRREEEAEARLSAANRLLVEAEKEEKEAAEGFSQLEPVWGELTSARERDRHLREELRVLDTRLERVLKGQRDVDAELGVLAEASKNLSELRSAVGLLQGLVAEDEKLRVLSEAESRRVDLAKQLEVQRERVGTLSKRVVEEETRGEALEDLKKAAAGQEEERERLERLREEVMSRWQRDAQDVESGLRILLRQAAELENQIEQLEAAGPDGVCPTCTRPLGAEFDRVLGLLRGQYEEVVQDGKWHRKRQEQLSSEPAEVTAATEQVGAAREEHERLTTDLAVAEAALARAAAMRVELEEDESQARNLAGAIAALPEGYDSDRHAQVRQRLEDLRKLEKQITQLETRLERQVQLKGVRAEAEEEEKQIRAQVIDMEAKRAELGFLEERYAAVSEQYEAARGRRDGASLNLERARGEADAARQAADATRREKREHQKLSRLIRQREVEHRLHNDLDAALAELRDELNDRVRPELSEIASVFLTELTDGRYNQIEINRDYEVVVLDGGEEKPVISGGEEDLANLVLRLAISQMIADRAGQTLSLLIFDEVFGGLDEHRRESVVRLLQRLQDRFEQVILITHIESVREGLDQVMRVAYDETTGGSVVHDESPGASGEALEVEDLAALVSE